MAVPWTALGAELRSERLALGLLALVACAPPAFAAEGAATAGVVWWLWPLALFVVCFALGVIAIPAGVGGDRKSTRLNSSHSRASRMPSSA